jgi:O-6-methylguanine DNA methyltransferase
MVSNDRDLFQGSFRSDLGTIEIINSETGIVRIRFLRGDGTDRLPNLDPLTREAILQLKSYLSQKLEQFDLPLHLIGTDFQQKVWQYLQKIPYGKTITYKELAIGLGDLNCIRAAASANGKNPLAIVIPCHRVIGQSGKLVGYSGELWRKSWLLENEKRSGQQQRLFELTING